jgi:hypothetical protein
MLLNYYSYSLFVIKYNYLWFVTSHYYEFTCNYVQTLGNARVRPSVWGKYEDKWDLRFS